MKTSSSWIHIFFVHFTPRRFFERRRDVFSRLFLEPNATRPNENGQGHKFLTDWLRRTPRPISNNLVFNTNQRYEHMNEPKEWEERRGHYDASGQWKIWWKFVDEKGLFSRSGSASGLGGGDNILGLLFLVVGCFNVRKNLSQLESCCRSLNIWANKCQNGPAVKAEKKKKKGLKFNIDWLRNWLFKRFPFHFAEKK